MKSLSLRKKLIFASILATLAPLLIVALFSLQIINHICENQINNHNYYAVQELGKSLDNIFKSTETLSRYVLINNDIRSYLANTSDDKSVEQRLYETALSALSYMPYANPYLLSLTVVSFDGKSIEINPGYSNIPQADIDAAIAKDGSSVWGVSIQRFSEAVTLTRLFRDIKRLSRHLGIVRASINLKDLHTLLKPSVDLPYAKYFVMDGNGNHKFSYSLSPDDAEALAQVDYAAVSQGSQRQTLGNDSYYVTKYWLAECGWYLIALLPSRYYVEYMKDSYPILVCAVLCALVFSVSLSVIFSHLVLRPLRTLNAQMQEIAAGNYAARIQVISSDEIGRLSEQFNAMSSILQKMYETVYLSELSIREAKIMSMQAQINPHFLYNTLDNIYWMALLDRSPQTADMIKALSSLFRLAFSVGMNKTIPLETELAQLKCYIAIQECRYKDSIGFSLTIEPRTEHCQVIPFVLQPLVENAINHGLANTDAGRIEICIARKEGDLLYTVADNGAGADEAQINEYLDIAKPHASGVSKGFSLYNINQRLKMFFGAEYGVAFHRLPEGGSRFLVRQPATEPALRGGEKEC